MAVELDRLYTYASQRLLDVTMKKDLTALSEVHKLLTEIRDAWQQIAKAAEGAAAGTFVSERLRLITEYRAGLEAEIALLHHLATLAERERKLTHVRTARRPRRCD